MNENYLLKKQGHASLKVISCLCTRICLHKCTVRFLLHMPEIMCALCTDGNSIWGNFNDTTCRQKTLGNVCVLNLSKTDKHWNTLNVLFRHDCKFTSKLSSKTCGKQLWTLSVFRNQTTFLKPVKILFKVKFVCYTFYHTPV